MNISLGFSPCPNDTFIFDALVNGKIDTGPYHFAPVLEDVQTLNEWALQGRLAMTKFSYGVWPQINGQYHLLDAGSALGIGVGPLLIARPGAGDIPLTEARVLVPGRHTTAHLLYRFAFPTAPQPQFVLFHEIESQLLAGEADWGVIIHENRFTYEARGLVLHTDLGGRWEAAMKVPVPLGGIALRSDLADHLPAINTLLRQSIALGWQGWPRLAPYVQQHAQAMEEAVMRQHIQLYVNEYTNSLGAEGRRAVEALTGVAAQVDQSSPLRRAAL